MRSQAQPRVERQLVAQRCDQLRDRVRDACTLIGYGDNEYGLSQFARLAETVARIHGLRFFKADSESKTATDLAVGSLKNLLFLGPGASGRSDHWVLDVWESTLDTIFHGVPPRSGNGNGDEPSPEVGVHAFAAPPPPSPSPPTRQDFAYRLLEAYLARDDDAMLALVDRLEQALGVREAN